MRVVGSESGIETKGIRKLDKETERHAREIIRQRIEGGQLHFVTPFFEFKRGEEFFGSVGDWIKEAIQNESLDGEDVDGIIAEEFRRYLTSLPADAECNYVVMDTEEQTYGQFVASAGLTEAEIKQRAEAVIAEVDTEEFEGTFGEKPENRDSTSFRVYKAALDDGYSPGESWYVTARGILVLELSQSG
jgi:hypothetical protein